MKFLISILFFISINSYAQFVAFPPASPPADSITSKGGLLTSNGVVQSEFVACAQGETIVWDPIIGTGVKCAAFPSSSPPVVTTSTVSFFNNTTAGNYLDIPGMAFNFTTDGSGNPVVVNTNIQLNMNFQTGVAGGSVTGQCVLVLFKATGSSFNDIGASSEMTYTGPGTSLNGQYNARGATQPLIHLATANTTYNYRLALRMTSGGSYPTADCQLRTFAGVDKFTAIARQL